MVRIEQSCRPCGAPERQYRFRLRGLRAEPEPAFKTSDIFLFAGIGAGVLLLANAIMMDNPARKRR